MHRGHDIAFLKTQVLAFFSRTVTPPTASRLNNYYIPVFCVPVGCVTLLCAPHLISSACGYSERSVLWQTASFRTQAWTSSDKHEVTNTFIIQPFLQLVETFLCGCAFVLCCHCHIITCIYSWECTHEWRHSSKHDTLLPQETLEIFDLPGR